MLTGRRGSFCFLSAAVFLLTSENSQLEPCWWEPGVGFWCCFFFFWVESFRAWNPEESVLWPEDEWKCWRFLWSQIWPCWPTWLSISIEQWVVGTWKPFCTDCWTFPLALSGWQVDDNYCPEYPNFISSCLWQCFSAFWPFVGTVCIAGYLWEVNALL